MLTRSENSLKFRSDYPWKTELEERFVTKDLFNETIKRIEEKLDYAVDAMQRSNDAFKAEVRADIEKMRADNAAMQGGVRALTNAVTIAGALFTVISFLYVLLNK